MELYGIDPKEISVVVRGLVVGNDQSDERKKFTKRSLASFRKYLPGAQVILSSWKGVNVSDLDYDDLILSDPPAELHTATPDGKSKLMTGNNQIVSTLNGMAVAKGKYAVVTRSDVVLTGTGFLKYFDAYNKDRGAALKKKVVVLPTYNPRKKMVVLLFNICDWFFFGLSEDIVDIFSIPLMNESHLIGEKRNGLFPQEKNFDAEQYLWINFLRKHQEVTMPQNDYFTAEAFKESERSYATNTIMVPANKAGVMCLRMPRAAYGARPILSQGLYTFNDYRRLYNIYNAHKVSYIPNPIEDLSYNFLLRIRALIRRMNPDLYKKIVNRIRTWNNSNDLAR